MKLFFFQLFLFDKMLERCNNSSSSSDSDGDELLFGRLAADAAYALLGGVVWVANSCTATRDCLQLNHRPIFHIFI
jgi:hypothetical protein